ncbi:hypothetical protein [Candidatus Nitrosocosmicus hydrocola]|uniref:hypothetical protein n=1 Tax=Candidatus Nitrosocosmicus hydrocola TaxID=1826872 RepID=UPI0011E58D5E|nr:hypothetical protein [Candidatus Nitrosocosmicus hydrocola]
MPRFILSHLLIGNAVIRFNFESYPPAPKLNDTDTVVGNDSIISRGKVIFSLARFSPSYYGIA